MLGNRSQDSGHNRVVLPESVAKLLNRKAHEEVAKLEKKLDK